MKKGKLILSTFLLSLSTSSESLAGNGSSFGTHEERLPSLPLRTAQHIGNAKSNQKVQSTQAPQIRESEKRQCIPMSYKSQGLIQEEARTFHQVTISIYAPKLIDSRDVDLTKPQGTEISLDPLLLPHSIKEIKYIGFLVTTDPTLSSPPKPIFYKNEGNIRTQIATHKLEKLQFKITATRGGRDELSGLECKMKVTYDKSE